MAYNNPYGESKEGESEKTSKYNSGWAQIERIDLIWRDAHKYRCSGIYKKWNEIIDGVWIELAGDLTEDNEATNKIKEFDKELNELFKTFKDGTVSINKEKVYRKLMEKEIFIRRLQNTLGKGTALKDVDEDDFE
jgi:hypothetical protein